MAMAVLSTIFRKHAVFPHKQVFSDAAREVAIC
jgi:hypothetical protein